MKVNVKTIWGAGFVSVSSPYINKARLSGEDLEVTCKGVTIKIPYEKYKDKTPRSASFNDKFGRRNDYSLYDFFWTDYLPKGVTK